MSTWRVAAVQMDCRLGDRAHNLETVRVRLRDAAGRGARPVAFPECARPGYAFEGKEGAWPHAEPVPGPATDAVAADCRRLGVWAAFGLLERAGADLFNACALVGPDAALFSYRKVHLP